MKHVKIGDLTFCEVSCYKYLNTIHTVNKNINIADLKSGSSKTQNVTSPTSLTHPLLKSRVSEQSLFRSEISLRNWSKKGRNRLKELLCDYRQVLLIIYPKFLDCHRHFRKTFFLIFPLNSKFCV